MKNKSKIHIHPLFLLSGVYFLGISQGKLFLLATILCFLAEGAKIWFGVAKGLRLKGLTFTPIGVRGEMNGVEKLSAKHQATLFLSGTGMSMVMAVVLFALEQKQVAMLSIILGCVRLLPLLPFDGGQLVFLLVSRVWGTIRMAGVLSKIGRGAGVGTVLFGVCFAVLFPVHLMPIFVGLYLVHANKQEVYYKIKQFLFQVSLGDAKRPMREVFVCGKEAPLELIGRMNPYCETVFMKIEDEGVGVSERRVFQAFLGQKDAEWMWQVAQMQTKEIRAKWAEFGYDDVM